MRRDAHPVEMVEVFCKQAAAMQSAEKDSYRAYGAGDTRRTAGRSTIGTEKPKYTAPNPPTAEASPDFVASQKSLPPPPVQ